MITLSCLWLYEWPDAVYAPSGLCLVVGEDWPHQGQIQGWTISGVKSAKPRRSQNRIRQVCFAACWKWQDKVEVNKPNSFAAFHQLCNPFLNNKMVEGAGGKSNESPKTWLNASSLQPSGTVDSLHSLTQDLKTSHRSLTVGRSLSEFQSKCPALRLTYLVLLLVG